MNLLKKFLAVFTQKDWRSSADEIKQHKLDHGDFFNDECEVIDKETLGKRKIAEQKKQRQSLVQSKATFLENYLLPDSPIKETLHEMIFQQHCRYHKDAEDGLYLVAKKRWSEQEFDGDIATYCSQLASDVDNAKWQYRETMYADGTTENVLSALKFGVIDISIKHQSNNKA